jgi:O-antigen/teichoic acid export membrane protein
MMLGAGLNQTLVAHACAVVVVFLYTVRAVRLAHLGTLSFSRSTLIDLVRQGTPFVFFGVAMVLQPTLDAIFLSKLAPESVVGWHAAARRLVGVLLLPIAALTSALYPTLCRLHATDPAGFLQAMKETLRATTLLVIPVALGCAIYPDIGIAIYGHKTFGRAEENLRILSLFLALVYFTMPLGVAAFAKGKQRGWAFVQSLCVLVSLVLDPILVPWFQRRTGNGGLGICTATVVSEIVVVACAIPLTGLEFYDRLFWRSFLSALLAGSGMTATAYLLRSLNSFLAAPLAVMVYAAILWWTGALEKRYLDAIRSKIAGKLGRLRVRAKVNDAR